jgi:starch-binding outer membrane protein, SusD/RagB family
MMRHLKYIIAALLCIQMSSCNKFLTLTPHDTNVVNSVEDYRDILASFMRYLKTPTLPSQDVVMGVGLSTLPFPSSDVDESLSIYTGESNLTTESSYYYDRTNNVYTQTGKNALTWLNTNSSAWDNIYSFLGPINPDSAPSSCCIASRVQV